MITSSYIFRSFFVLLLFFSSFGSQAACPTPSSETTWYGATIYYFEDEDFIAEDSCGYTGNYEIRGTTNVYGDLTIDGNMTVTGTLNIYGTVTVTGTTASGFGGEINIYDGGRLDAQNGLATGFIGAFNVYEGGDADITGDVNMGVGAAMIIEGNMDVSGDFNSSYNSSVTLSNGGDLSVGGDFNNNENSTVTVGDGSVLTVDQDFNNNEDDSTLIIEEGGAVLAQNFNNNNGGTITNNNPDGECTSECCGADCPGLLPVELIYFGHETIHEMTTLNWVTASETNNSGFEVQRQYADEESFTVIGFVNGNGTSKSQHEYTFPVYNDTKDAYYRLKQIDYDGRFEFSPIVLVGGIKAMSLSIFPNPFTSQIRLSGAAIDECRLYDLSGHLIGQWSKVSNAVLEEQIPATIGNKKGTYLLKTSSTAGSATIRLIKD